MAIVNSYVYTSTVFLWEKFEEATGNNYLVVATRPYKDKKGVLPDGISMTLQVLSDNYDYGIDKRTNKPRESNLYCCFDVTVLNDKLQVKKGDRIQLLQFDKEHSYVISFDLILRFRDAKVLQSPTQAQGVNRK
ncbi:MAG: hypothetical protein IJR00_05160 [Lachnospiraceae bacterium]|nr:hypothetical protein [Lachnospiraceae bacterium]